MVFKVHDWTDISGDYLESSLFIGNGASMAISDKFNYKSLLLEAEKNGDIREQVAKLFRSFRTTDFELVLRLVWQASLVNASLEIVDGETKKAYESIRDSLIRAVRHIHPSHEEIRDLLPKIHIFAKKFRTIFSFNYDLIVYWLIMYARKLGDDHAYKDCFLNGTFATNWRRLREPIGAKKSTTLVFYPHGNLALARSIIGVDQKINTDESGILLESILGSWKAGKVTPLFVSEGNAEQKVISINQSRYLSTILNDIYSDVDESIVIYGWGIGEQDQYVLKSINETGRKIKKVAASIYNENQDECERLHKIIQSNLGKGVDVTFFHSTSPGCWIN